MRRLRRASPGEGCCAVRLRRWGSGRLRRPEGFSGWFWRLRRQNQPEIGIWGAAQGRCISRASSGGVVAPSASAPAPALAPAGIRGDLSGVGFFCAMRQMPSPPTPLPERERGFRQHPNAESSRSPLLPLREKGARGMREISRQDAIREKPTLESTRGWGSGRLRRQNHPKTADRR
jgi:hypothetical protein